MKSYLNNEHKLRAMRTIGTKRLQNAQKKKYRAIKKSLKKPIKSIKNITYEMIVSQKKSQYYVTCSEIHNCAEKVAHFPSFFPCIIFYVHQFKIKLVAAEATAE